MPRKVVVVAGDVLPLKGWPSTGAGLRAWSLGKGLESKGHYVSFLMPKFIGEKLPMTRLPDNIHFFDLTAEAMTATIESLGPDIVVFQHWPLVPLLRRTGSYVVIDFHGPHILERIMQGAGDLKSNASVKLNAIQKADFFTCAGEYQRRYFIAWLVLAGVRPDESIIRSIPVSMSPDLPKHTSSGEITFVYGGIFLPWQDPSMALRCVARALDRYETGRLRIFAGKHPVHPISTGVFDRLLNDLHSNRRVEIYPLIGHDALLSEYVRAHVAVDVMRRNWERELAFTTRTVEYLWSGLPVIHNDYSELSEYIEKARAGWLLDPCDGHRADELVKSIIDHPAVLEDYSKNAQELVRRRFTWEKTIGPLHDFCESPTRREREDFVSGGTIRPSNAYLLRSGLQVLREQGPIEFATKVAEYLRRRIAA